MYLKQVDQLVKEGNYEHALDIIAQVRAANPKDFYALAYEERVLALLHNRDSNSNQEGHDSSLEEEALSVEIPTQEMLKSSALQERLEAILARARDRAGRSEFKQALDDLKRAEMIAPSHPEIETLRHEILDTQAKVDREREKKEEKEAELEQRNQRIAVQADLERIQRDEKEKHLREHAARKLAQQEKILQYVAQAKELFNSDRMDDALRELVFVDVIDPDNTDAKRLRKNIEKRKEKLQREASRKEEERKKQEQIRDTIRRHIEDANRLTAEREYDEALSIVTRAYLIDPSNEDLQRCEERILAMQDAALKQEAEERRLVEEARKTVLAEERRKQELERILQEKRAEEAIRKESERRAISLHLQAGRDHLKGRRFDEALEEIAKAFILDPFDAEVKRLEGEVLLAQRQRTEAQIGEDTGTASTVSSSASDHQAAIKILSRSLEYYDKGNLPQALEEIDKGLLIAPDQADLKKFREIVEHDLASAVNAAAETDTSLIRYLEKTRAFIDLGDFESALTEIALGLTTFPHDDSLKNLEKEAWRLYEGVSRDSTEGEPLSASEKVKMHLIASEQFKEQGDFGSALKEIMHAYELDPDNKEIRKAEIALHQVELQKTHGENPKLKLVYRKKNAAG